MVVNRETFNILQVGIGFFFIFFAFNSQGFIEESVINSAHDRGHINKHAGYYSLSLIYGVCTLGNLVAAPIIKIISAKWAMTIGACTYFIFELSFLHLNETLLYLSSVLLGFGAAVLWTGQGVYLAENCTEKTSERRSGLLWGVLFAGGIFLYIIFHSSNTTDGISKGTTNTVYTVYAVLTAIGIVIFATLRQSQKPQPSGTRKSHTEHLVNTVKLAFTPRMYMLAFTFAFMGVETSFWSGIYPTCIHFTRKLGHNTNTLLSINAMTQGLGQIVGGALIGFLGRKVQKIGRDVIILISVSIHLLVFVAVYANIPRASPNKKNDDEGSLVTPSAPLALACSFFLALGDAGWNTQINSLLVDAYHGQSASAFAIFKFYKSAMACAAFYYGSHVELQWHLLIMAATSVVGAAAFFIVERMERKHGSISEGSTESTDFPSTEGRSPENGNI